MVWQGNTWGYDIYPWWDDADSYPYNVIRIQTYFYEKLILFLTESCYLTITCMQSGYTGTNYVESAPAYWYFYCMIY